MDWTVVLAVVLGAVVLLFAIRWLFRRPATGGRRPPVKSGWIPWIGCAIPFGKQPLNFIQRTKEELQSDVFTIHVAGKWMSFVTNHKDYPLYFQTTHIDFPAAVQPFTNKAGGLCPKSFSKYHTTAHDTVKGKLVPAYMSTMCPKLSHGFYVSLCSHGDEGEMELMDFVRHAMFEAVVRELFGRENTPKTQEEMRELERKFVKYDADFEYGAELPEIFLKDWRECKYWLLSVFKLMVAGVREQIDTKRSEDKTLLETLLDVVDKTSGPNFALLFLWASQANAIPAVFWTLAYILSNPTVYSTLKNDVTSIQSDSEDGEFCPISEESLKGAMSVKRAILEAVRLHSPGMITRKVLKDLSINEYTVPAGHLLMLSPYWSHRDKEKFPEPEKFNPDRWLKCDLEKNQFLDGFVGFGGGRYQCPGRWFALMEMHLFVTMVIQMFDLELQDPVPLPSPLHLVGAQQPTTSCRVRYKRR